jgi:ATP-dependent DNA helicase RecQ
VLDDSGSDDSVPPDLVAALVQVLAAWDWEQRPAGVVTLPSHTRPQLIASLGERIAEIGRLPMLGSLSYAGSGPRAGASGAQQFNSPQRLQAVWRELRLPGPLAAAVASLGGPVLVIDDRIDSGWTMTVAARLLREAGAPRVLPLVLAVNAG